jgi:aspartate carbamoyltransferase catalytic subunit
VLLIQINAFSELEFPDIALKFCGEIKYRRNVKSFKSGVARCGSHMGLLGPCSLKQVL